MKRQVLAFLAVSLAVTVVGAGAVVLRPVDGVFFTNPVDINYFGDPIDRGLGYGYSYYSPQPYYQYFTPPFVLYPNSTLIYPDVQGRQLEKLRNGYFLTRRQYWYGDRNEFYGFKRGPKLREHPPYRAYGPEAKPMGIPKVDLSWSKEGNLKVSWAQRTQPVTSVQLAFIDEFGKELSQQKVTKLPLQENLTVPEGATDLRVTVNYADGGVSSSAVELPK